MPHGCAHSRCWPRDVPRVSVIMSYLGCCVVASAPLAACISAADRGEWESREQAPRLKGKDASKLLVFRGVFFGATNVPRHECDWFSSPHTLRNFYEIRSLQTIGRE